MDFPGGEKFRRRLQLMKALIIDNVGQESHAAGMRTRFLNRYGAWTVDIALVGSGTPSGNIVAYRSTLALCIQYAIDNGYKVISRNYTDGINASASYKAALAAGVISCVSHAGNVHIEIEAPSLYDSPIFIGGGITVNEQSYGRHLELFDASTTNETAESWASASFGARMAKAIDDFPEDNLYDIRQRLRQAASYYNTGWILDGGYGRAGDILPSVPANQLDLAPPMEYAASVSWNKQIVTFTWKNYLQTRFANTRISRNDGTIIYRGADESFEWHSDVVGNETFKFYTEDAAGNLSPVGIFPLLPVTGLYRYYSAPTEVQSRYHHRSSLGARKFV